MSLAMTAVMAWGLNRRYSARSSPSVGRLAAALGCRLRAPCLLPLPLLSCFFDALPGCCPAGARLFFGLPMAAAGAADGLAPASAQIH